MYIIILCILAGLAVFQLTVVNSHRKLRKKIIKTIRSLEIECTKINYENKTKYHMTKDIKYKIRNQIEMKRLIDRANQLRELL